MQMAEFGRRAVSQDWGVSPTILVITNDVILSTLLIEALHLAFGGKIHTISNGRCALEGVTRSKPDLLLIDDQLIDVDLLELSDQQHSNQERERIPTIFLASHFGTWSRRGGYPLIFLRKPFTLDRLYAVVQQALAASEEWVGSLSAS